MALFSLSSFYFVLFLVLLYMISGFLFLFKKQCNLKKRFILFLNKILNIIFYVILNKWEKYKDIKIIIFKSSAL
ncbi:hypothetical protein B1F79_01865 [Coxiella-like endosymbiont of Rhipicephalus sanguineus]|nr:hypothetical protein [Coxiella-like endosymbiont of Rhipicephalus sanguineus]